MALPSGEAFSAGKAGPAARLVQRLASSMGGTVLGAPVPEQFGGIDFRAVRPGWLAGSARARYEGALVRAVKAAGPSLIEVHDAPQAALRIAQWHPRVLLFLHQHPADLGAGSPSQRQALLGQLARVVVMSNSVQDALLDGVSGTAEWLPAGLAVPASIRRVRQKCIVFAGRLTAATGADVFIEACRMALPQLPGWQAEIIGTGPSVPEAGFVEALHRQAAQAGVTWHGTPGHEAAIERLDRAAMAVVPSRSRALSSQPAMEGMAHGAALICSTSPELAAAAGDAAVFAPAGDAAAFAAAIVSLAQDTRRRLAMATDGHRRALLLGTTETLRIVRDLRSAILDGRNRGRSW